MGIGFIKANLFFPSVLIRWSVIYFIIAYCKFHLPRIMDDCKINMTFLISGLALNTIAVIITNILGLHIAAFSDKLQHWLNHSNPFLTLSVIGAINLARQRTFHNMLINYISGLSLLIYVIHENILVRSYVRPMIWQWIYGTFGFSHVLLWVIIFSLIFFIASGILAAIYKTISKNFKQKLIDMISDSLKNVYGKVEERILRLN